FAEVARRLASKTAEEVKSRSLEERAQAVVDLVSSLGGLAMVKKHPEHLEIKGISCPFSAIACEHSQVCQMVAKLVSEIAQAPVIERCKRGEKVQCNFEILLK